MTADRRRLGIRESGESVKSISRRDFLRHTSAGGAGLWASLRIQGKEADVPLFRFHQINDTHVQAPIPEADRNPDLPTYEGANERMKVLMECIGREAPDFVLGVGDLIHGERLDRLAPDLECLREFIRPLRVPLYTAVGNHEVVQQEGDPKHEKAYRDAFGNDRVNYVFGYRGLLFVVFNNGGASMGVREEARRARNRWVRETLTREREKPKVLCCHVPLVPVREEAVLARSFGFRSYIAHDEELLGLVREHAETVIAVLAGHLHLTGVVQDEGVFHIVPSGTASLPHDYARFDVFPDRIRVQMVGLPAMHARPKTNIHGPPRYAEGCTDREHKTHDLYLKGQAKERDFEIPLTIKKRPRP